MFAKKYRLAVGAAVYLGLLVLPWAGVWLTARYRSSVSVGGGAEWTEPRYLALTFDDGPKAETTPVLLDGLAQRGVEATFFLITDQLPGQEELVKRMVDAGHQVGIHTAGHQCLVGVDDTTFTQQVAGAREALAEVTGMEDFLLRPPYGLLDEGVRKRAESPIILWSIDTEDWKYKDAQRVKDWIVSHAEDGAIILLHDIYSTSVEGALAAVDELEREGYRFVTVDELARLRGVELQDGESYTKFPPREEVDEAEEEDEGKEENENEGEEEEVEKE